MDHPAPMPPPGVSVIMATYNGAAYIQQSLASLRAQTYRDFEIIVVDDGSTDATPEILAAFGDPRLRVVRNSSNLGVVGSRNRCFELVRGRYVAMLDHDDISRPTRFADQVAYLDAHPDTVVLGTRAHELTRGTLATRVYPPNSTPLVIEWLLHVGNPLVCSSIMFRTEQARRLPGFMRAEYEYADDYDFYHRMAEFGKIARLDKPLTIYRLHESNTFRRSEEKMTSNAVRVLAPALRKLLGDAGGSAADAIVRHIAAGAPVTDDATLSVLRTTLEALGRHYVGLAAGDAGAAATIVGYTQTLWRRVIRVAARQGDISGGRLLQPGPLGFVPSLSDKARIAAGRLPPQALNSALKRVLTRPAPVFTPRTGKLYHHIYAPLPIPSSEPPRLFVVVDTEAEFDWSGPFARDLTTVNAMDRVERGQAIFDRWGLRPIYVIDYPIASQPRGYTPLLGILARNACVIGAHGHPWTNPPFEEEPSVHNSFPGNLPPGLEARKLELLIATITANLGVTPMFYRAGRYGFGPHTAETLTRLGIPVDISLLPGADLRFKDGPDFRSFDAVPYRIAGTDIISLPVTRARIGAAPRLGLPALPGVHHGPLPALLARLHIDETITLTPEGVTTSEQIRLIRALLARGHRDFVLHYHSPSLAPGNTPYVRSDDDLRQFLTRLDEICAFFFEDIAGLPGNPIDLLPGSARA